MDDYNQIRNGGFENATALWYNSGLGTFTAQTTDTNRGKVAISYDATGSGDYFQSELRDIESFVSGQSCELFYYYKGGDSNYKVQVLDGVGSTVVEKILTTQASYTKESIKFSCGTQHRIKVIATADGARD